jgi:site-specific DNA-methyltransferase (adenine-specific)
MQSNVIYHGNCLEVMDTFPDNSIDMVFCDLPYGTTQNPWDILIPFDDLWLRYNRIVKDDGAIVLTAQSPFDKLLACSNLKQFKYEWIWEKNKATGHLNAKKMPMKAHESVLIFYKKLPVYNPQMTDGHKPMNMVSPKDNVPKPEVTRNYGHVEKVLGNPGGSTIRYPRDVIKIPVINNDDPKKFHPTQKPIPLIEYFIRTYTNEGDVVLDNCMGSGSTCIAASNQNRKYIGIEQSEEYFNKAKQWIEEETRGGLLAHFD